MAKRETQTLTVKRREHVKREGVEKLALALWLGVV